MKTDMLCVVESTHNNVIVEMTGDGEDSGESSRDEDDFEKQMSLTKESDTTSGYVHVT